MKEKRCRVCFLFLKRNEFLQSEKSYDGLETVCKKCKRSHRAKKKKQKERSNEVDSSWMTGEGEATLWI